MPNIIDLPKATNTWQEVDRALYNQLPIYLNKRQVEYIKEYDIWGKLLDADPWVANVGTTMRGVNKVPAPTVRGQFLPNPITQEPLRDIIEVRETREDVQLYRHNFESGIFHFLSTFQDFLTDHIDFHSEQIAEKIIVGKDLFYRTAIFHGSPFIYICGPTDGLTEVRTAPSWVSPAISLIKTQAYLQTIIPKIGGTLDLRNIKKLGTVMYSDLRAVPFTGKLLPDGTDGNGLKQKYCLVCSSEVWDGFTDDNAGSYLLENKALDLDVVTAGFQGSLFGRWTTKHECKEMRIALDGTIPAPDSVEESGAAYDFGDTVPNPVWVNAPIGVAWAVGSSTWKAKRVGPPPKYFADGMKGMTLNQFNSMDWSGKVHLTRNLLVPRPDGGGTGGIIYDTNKYGDRCQLIADAVMGIAPLRRRNLVPILYRRQRIATS